MTKEEAIKRLESIVIRDALQEDYDALDMAIEALEEQKTGHWIIERISEIGGDKWSTNPKCSICGGEPYYSNSIYNYKYCPYCGAKNESR